MIDILTAALEFEGGEYVFSTTLGDRPIQCFTKPKKQIDKGSGVSDWDGMCMILRLLLC